MMVMVVMIVMATVLVSICSIDVIFVQPHIRYVIVILTIRHEEVFKFTTKTSSQLQTITTITTANPPMN